MASKSTIGAKVLFKYFRKYADNIKPLLGFFYREYLQA